MMKLFLVKLFVSFFFILIPLTAFSAQNPCEDLETDLKFVHEQIKTNSSIYNYSAKARRVGKKAYKQALKEIPHCQDITDYSRTLKKYIAAYREPHMFLSLIRGEESMTTGLIMVNYNHRYFIKAVDRKFYKGSELDVGDELLSCNGKTAKKMMKNDVLIYMPNSSTELGKYRGAWGLFIRTFDRSKKNVTCTFKRYNTKFKVLLAWQKLNQIPFLYNHNFSKKSDKQYTKQKTDYGYWISLKSFRDHTVKQARQLKLFLKDAEMVKKSEIIVLDLRENGGGNSSWGTKWIKSLWGYTEEIFSGPILFWSTKDNYIDTRDWYVNAKRVGSISSKHEKNVQVQCLLERLLQNFGKFVEIDHRYDYDENCQLTIEGKETQVNEKEKRQKDFFKGKVFVLTNEFCFSSCELFLMELRRMPGVTHVGIVTGGTTLFGDVGDVRAPSGRVGMMLPKKVFPFIDKKRGVTFKPDIPLKYNPELEFQGVDSLRKAVEKLIL